jgi:hypothetical protein
MTHLIGLNSFNLYESPRILEIAMGELSYDTLFDLDRALRQVIALNPHADWGLLEQNLRKAGFVEARDDGRNVFWHSRNWDEHLLPPSESFFVSFPKNASVEVADKIFLATNFPAMFAVVPTVDINSRSFLIVTGGHDLIYPDEMLWEDEFMLKKIPLGPVIVIENQFATQEQFNAAKNKMASSGYEVAN